MNTARLFRGLPGKALSLIIAIAMAASLLILPASAADEIEFSALNGDTSIISLSAEKSFTASFTAEGDVGADSVSWSLARDKGMQDVKIYPYQYLGGKLEDWKTWETDTAFFKDIETRAEKSGSDTKLTLTFGTGLFFGVNRADSPRPNRNAVLDHTGDFVLSCSDEKGEVLAQTTVRVNPYDDYRTNTELANQLSEAAKAAAEIDGLHVEKRSLGTSTQGYDMPYAVIADSKASIDAYLAQTARALQNPEAVLNELKAGTLDYKVPVMFTNIHADEMNGSDAPMNFVWDIVRSMEDDGKIKYDMLTGFTADGEAKLKAEMEAQGIQWSDLVKDYVTGLGFIKGDNEASGKVDLEKYYTVETVEFDVKKALETLIFIVCPAENADGRTNNARQNGNGFDINRDTMFQTQVETQNMSKAVAMWNPITLVELHGFVAGYQVEPCSPPHEPNFEYDLFAEYGLKSGEAFGIGAAANNEEFNSYVMPLRDYLVTDDSGKPYWEAPWDDMSTNYTPQYSMLHGTVGFTIEVPVANQQATVSLEYGLIGHAAFVADNAEAMYENQLTGWVRGMKNEDAESVGKWYVDMNDTAGAEKDVYRPKREGNNKFFPECYIIPMDAESQTNLSAAYAMQKFLIDNGVVVHSLNEDTEIGGKTYKAESMVVSMYQSKRNVANGALYDGVLITDWTDLYSEPVTAFGKMRGFSYDAIDTVGAVDEENLTVVTEAQTAAGAFTGMENAQVIIDNNSVDAVAMVNAMLDAGTKVGFVTEGGYTSSFVVSHADYLAYKDKFIVKATGVETAPKAQLLSKAKLYIPGFAGDYSLTKDGKPYGALNFPNYGNTNYNFDKFAYGKQMGFAIVSDPDDADVIAGNRALDDKALAAVKGGKPYLAAGADTLEKVKQELLEGFDFVSSGTNQDALYTVTYNTDSLITATYANSGDNIVYSYGGAYISAVPDGARVLMTATEDTPYEGFMMKKNLSGFLGSVQAIDYTENGLDITVFAGSLTNKAHQQDDYQFAANAIFTKTMGGSYDGSTETPEPGDTAMTDIKGHWAFDEIVYCMENQLFNGTSATTFEPDTVMSRAMVATALWRIDGSPAAEKTASFTDVAAGSWYENAVNWAVKTEVMQGYGGGRFGSDDNITREQLAATLYRYSKYKGYDVSAKGDLSKFTDTAAISDWALESIEYSVGAGLINGMTSTTIAPSGTALRCQVAAILARFHEAH